MSKERYRARAEGSWHVGPWGEGYLYSKVPCQGDQGLGQGRGLAQFFRVNIEKN